MGPSGQAGGSEARLSGFLAACRWEDVPREIRREARRALLNIAGCVLAGRDDPAVQLVRRTFPGEDALVDAAAATAHDYDDTHLRTVIHATPPLAGALFSLARTRAVSGPELLHAWLLGMEVTCRLGNAVTPGHYERGWHITSTCGIFGVTAAASKVLKLSASQTLSALGIAATQASGLVEMLGSMARVLNAGFAARNGLQAALLAAEGFEGPARPLDGLRGFYSVFGGEGDKEALTAGLGQHWELSQVRYKPYPSGVVLHALLDACLDHREAIRSSPEVIVSLSPLAVERTNRPEPKNAIEARLSAHHAVAVAALRGRAGLEEFSDAAALAPDLKEFRRKVRVQADAALDKMAAVVRAGGKTIQAPAARVLDDAGVEAKLRELAGARAKDWLRFADSLESAKRVALPD